MFRINKHKIVENCAKHFNIEYFRDNKIVVRHGELGFKFYIILKGDVDIYVPKKERFHFDHQGIYQFVKENHRLISSINGIKHLPSMEIIEAYIQNLICYRVKNPPKRK